jgi:hypothetical protein
MVWIHFPDSFSVTFAPIWNTDIMLLWATSMKVEKLITCLYRLKWPDIRLWIT